MPVGCATVTGVAAPRKWAIADTVLAGALSFLAVCFLAWAGVVYKGVAAVEGQLADWRDATRQEIQDVNSNINVMALDIALIKSEVKAIRSWQMQHGVRPHREAIERLQGHEMRLNSIEKDFEKLEQEKLNRAFPNR